MTLFILRADADSARVAALARAAERRGEFVEEEDGASAGRRLEAHDRTVLAWSRAAAESLARDGLERRAIEAWALDRLTIVRLDADAPLPIALKDIAPLTADALYHPDVALDRLYGPAPAPARPAPPKRRGPPAWGLFVLIVSIVSGAGAVASALQAAPAAWFGPAFAVSLASAIAAVWLGLHRRARKVAAVPAPARPGPPEGAPAPPGLIIAYAADDLHAVEPWLGDLEAAAGPIAPVEPSASGPDLLRTVRAARAVLVVCSPAGFAAPHVHRAAYLADREGRPIAPVVVRPAPAPDDFAYYFAGVEPLELFRLEPEERAAAVAGALPPV